MSIRAPEHCAHCGKPATVKCGHCKAVRYCTGGCQSKDWYIHKTVCPWTDEIGERPSANHRLAILLPEYNIAPRIVWIATYGEGGVDSDQESGATLQQDEIKKEPESDDTTAKAASKEEEEVKKPSNMDTRDADVGSDMGGYGEDDEGGYAKYFERMMRDAEIRKEDQKVGVEKTSRLFEDFFATEEDEGLPDLDDSSTGEILAEWHPWLGDDEPYVYNVALVLGKKGGGEHLDHSVRVACRESMMTDGSGVNECVEYLSRGASEQYWKGPLLLYGMTKVMSSVVCLDMYPADLTLAVRAVVHYKKRQDACAVM